MAAFQKHVDFLSTNETMHRKGGNKVAANQKFHSLESPINRERIKVHILLHFVLKYGPRQSRRGCRSRQRVTLFYFSTPAPSSTPTIGL